MPDAGNEARVSDDAGKGDPVTELQRQEALLKTVWLTSWLPWLRGLLMVGRTSMRATPKINPTQEKK